MIKSQSAWKFYNHFRNNKVFFPAEIRKRNEMKCMLVFLIGGVVLIAVIIAVIASVAGAVAGGVVDEESED